MWGKNVCGSCVGVLDKVFDISLKDVSMVGMYILCLYRKIDICWKEWRSANKWSRGNKECKIISLKVCVPIKDITSWTMRIEPTRDVIKYVRVKHIPVSIVREC